MKGSTKRSTPDSSERSASSPIDEVKRYEFITKMLIYTNDKIIEAFSLFLKVTSAIIGGIVWLSIQQNTQDVKANLAPIVPWMFILVGTVSILLIIVNLRTWWGFREAESRLVGPANVPPPTFPRSCLGELVMIAVIIATTLIGVVVLRL